jgi:hypothetical protein
MKILSGDKVLLGKYLLGKFIYRIGNIHFLKVFEKDLIVATKKLDHPDIQTRLTAISTLEQIAHNYPLSHWEVIEILAGFVRTAKIKSHASSRIGRDIQAALSVICGRDTNKDPKNEQLDLSYANMQGANLQHAHLQGANLTGANLSKANLADADLQQTILCAANLSEANLAGANLSQAILGAAKLHAANLTGANLSQANLFLANLVGANLVGANLCGCNLRDVILYPK